MTIPYSAGIKSSGLTYFELKQIILLFHQVQPWLDKRDCQQRVLAIATNTPHALQLIATYCKALELVARSHPNALRITCNSFAASVAQLCHDDPRVPQNKRSAALMELLKLSGGPTVREYAVMWAAFGKGDAVRVDGDLTAFYVDERFPLPGTWDFEKACQFAENFCFGQITDFHRQVWKAEKDCFDDPVEDIKALKNGSA